MRRSFTDSAFREFMTSDTLLARLIELRAARRVFEGFDVQLPARQALAFLPNGARIEARLYPMIKPATNTFVFGLDSVAGIFLYLDPRSSVAQARNSLVHELHHIGYGTVCEGRADSAWAPHIRMLYRRMFAFGEGMAMLAAAGGGHVHPHAASEAADRARWDRDVANAGQSMRELEAYFLEVLGGRLTDPDSVVRRALTFYGIQGPVVHGRVDDGVRDRAGARPGGAHVHHV